MTEVFETQSEGYITSPVKPDAYAEKRIRYLQIPTPDYPTIFFQSLQRGVEFVHWCLSNGTSTLVHCKAGKGRSFLVVVCYSQTSLQARARETTAIGVCRRQGRVENSREI